MKRRAKINGEIIELNVCSWFGKVRGLMFKQKKNAQALLFEFRKPTKIKIHSFFVFFPFIAVWLNDSNEITDIKIVKPFEGIVSPKGYFSKLLEIPINEKYKEITSILVGERFK